MQSPLFSFFREFNNVNEKREACLCIYWGDNVAMLVLSLVPVFFNKTDRKQASPFSLIMETSNGQLLCIEVDNYCVLKWI